MMVAGARYEVARRQKQVYCLLVGRRNKDSNHGFVLVVTPYPSVHEVWRFC